MITQSRGQQGQIIRSHDHTITRERMPDHNKARFHPLGDNECRKCAGPLNSGMKIELESSITSVGYAVPLKETKAVLIGATRRS